jgi:hypothetical protein
LAEQDAVLPDADRLRSLFEFGKQFGIGLELSRVLHFREPPTSAFADEIAKTDLTVNLQQHGPNNVRSH